MKKLVSLSLILTSSLLFGQTKESPKYSINAKIGYSIPIQGSYLKTNYNGGPYLSLNFIKKSSPIDFVAGCDYEYISLSDKVNFITPHIGILHSFKKDKFSFSPSFNLGYTWIYYTYDITISPPIPVQEFHQNGFSISADLMVAYDFTDKFQLGIGDSYLNIFESFGTTDPKPDNSKFIGLNRLFISLLLKI